MSTKSSTLPAPSEWIDIPQAAECCGVSEGSFRRWLRDGVLSGGQRVKPRHVFVGGRIRTTQAWLDDFIHAVTEGRSGRSAAVNDQVARRADAVLAATGW
jgi:hypothetical protein